MKEKFKHISTSTHNLDAVFLLETLEEFINTPSPVGFYELGNELLQKYADELAYPSYLDERRCFYIEVKGENSNKKIQLGAHMDTLGYMVDTINENGTISLKELGGIQNHSVEHEKFYLFTRDLKCYTGYLLLKHHSVHVYEDARTMPRDIENMRFYLDEDVHSYQEVIDLGIRVGDVLAPEPRFEVLDNGRIRSRFLDNKASVSVLLTMLKYLKENDLKPKYDTIFSFPYYEEVNAGGAYIPPGVTEYVALDIGAMSENNRGTERSVSIIVADKHLNYDRELTGKLVGIAEDIGIPFSNEIFPRYSTDSMCAFRAGHNLKHAAFGMNVLGTHGMERTFLESIYHTAELCLEYILSV